MDEITKAKNRVMAHQKRLAEERERNKPSINERMIEEGKSFIDSYDFWCDVCEEDFTASASRHVHRLYGEPMVTYRAHHECGEECVRLITHRDADPYYDLSEKIHEQRNEYTADLLRHEDYGFKTLYGEPFEDYNKRLKKREERKILEREGQGFKKFL